MQRSSFLNGAFFIMQMMFLVTSHIIPENKKQKVDLKKILSKPCWQSEKIYVIGECSPCSEVEKSNQLACKETGSRKLIQCEKSNGTLYISCTVAKTYEKQQFWKFEALTLAGAVLSNVFVWWRRRNLNRVYHQRVKRQMSSAAI